MKLFGRYTLNLRNHLNFRQSCLVATLSLHFHIIHLHCLSFRHPFYRHCHRHLRCYDHVLVCTYLVCTLYPFPCIDLCCQQRQLPVSLLLLCSCITQAIIYSQFTSLVFHWVHTSRVRLHSAAIQELLDPRVTGPNSLNFSDCGMVCYSNHHLIKGPF